MRVSSALKAGGLVFILLFMVAVGGAANAAEPPAVKVTYLYDNTSAVAGTDAAWGFSALVEAHGKRVLFDTGGNAGVLRHNVAVWVWTSDGSMRSCSPTNTRTTLTGSPRWAGATAWLPSIPPAPTSQRRS